MKSFVKNLLLLLIILSVYASCDRQPYVLAEEVEISYKDTIRVNDWISIDGVKFTHVNNYDQMKEDSLNTSMVYEKNALPTTKQKILVPGGGDHEFGAYSSPSDIAMGLFQALSLSEKNDLGQFYGFRGHILDLSTGKFVFYRKDGEKIKVMTSKGYGGVVRKLK